MFAQAQAELLVQELPARVHQCTLASERCFVPRRCVAALPDPVRAAMQTRHGAGLTNVGVGSRML